MIITNKHNLPAPLVSVIKNDPYDAGLSDISTTSLISPPRIVQLRKRHDHEITEDVADNIYRLIGSNTHHILELIDNAGCIKERRFYGGYNGWVVSGQIDLYEINPAILSDYKVTSVWSVINGLKPEHEAQLNINAELMRHEGIDPKRLQIVNLLRDWSMRKAHEAGYPNCQVFVQDVPRWKVDFTKAYIDERISIHKEAKNLHDKDLPVCTPDERWERPTKYAVMKKGRKSALRLLDSESEAEDYIELKGLAIPTHYIEIRDGESVRCEMYCNVNGFCNQYKGKE